MKRIVSFCLAVVMWFSVSTTALAVSRSEFDIQVKSLASAHGIAMKEMEQRIIHDQNNFKYLRFDPEVLSPKSINEEGKIVYRVMFGSIANDIVTETTANGDRVFHFYEDSLHTELKIVDGVGLFVNGVFAQPINHNHILASEMTQTRGRQTVWDTEPIFPVSSYVIDAGVYEGNTVSWGVSTLVGLAVGAITAIVINSIAGVIGLSFSGQLIINAFTGFAAAMKTRCEIYGMEDAYFSFKFDRYKSNATNPTEVSYMFEGACYSRRDYEGTEYPHTMFYWNFFA